MLVCLFFSDERKEIERLITQNGGKYSAELTKKCTHLISDISFFMVPLEECTGIESH
jgi:hypothetical protein